MNEGWRTPTPSEWIAELTDEENPDTSPVIVRRANGDRSGAMTMPQEVYWALRESYSSDPTHVPLQYRGVEVVRLPPTLAHLKGP